MHHKESVHDNEDLHLKLLELVKSNQSYKSTIQNLLEQHKKLISGAMGVMERPTDLRIFWIPQWS